MKGPQKLRVPPEDLRCRRSRSFPAWKRSPISGSSASGKKRPRFGDRSEIRDCPKTARVWAKLDARSDICSGQKCPQFERCFLTLMHQRAIESDIIIVNHHLFFADLALKDEDFTQIIPEYSRRGFR